MIRPSCSIQGDVSRNFFNAANEEEYKCYLAPSIELAVWHWDMATISLLNVDPCIRKWELQLRAMMRQEIEVCTRNPNCKYCGFGVGYI